MKPFTHYIPVIVLLASLPVFAMRHGDISFATIAYVVGTAGWSIIRIVITDKSPISVVQSYVDGKERALLMAVFVGMFILPLLALYTPLLDATLYDPSTPGTLIGIASMLTGLYVFYRSHKDLGRFWSPSLDVREGHQLVTRGIYARMRHPMYTALFLICAAQAFLLENWLAGIAGIITFTVLYVLRIRREEDMMVETFGDDYRAYAQKTPRLFPKLRS